MPGLSVPQPDRSKSSDGPVQTMEAKVLAKEDSKLRE
jgi:hypothetical protein